MDKSELDKMIKSFTVTAVDNDDDWLWSFNRFSKFDFDFELSKIYNFEQSEFDRLTKEVDEFNHTIAYGPAINIENAKASYTMLIEQWAKNRGLDKSNSDKQLIKLAEEVGELAEAHNKEWKDKQIDSIGDAFVVLTIYALQNGLRIDDCIKEAYDTIKNRDGKMVDGVFVKSEDLEDEQC